MLDSVLDAGDIAMNNNNNKKKKTTQNLQKSNIIFIKKLFWELPLFSHQQRIYNIHFFFFPINLDLKWLIPFSLKTVRDLVLDDILLFSCSKAEVCQVFTYFNFSPFYPFFFSLNFFLWISLVVAQINNLVLIW